MKKYIFNRIEEITYSCHILFPFILLNAKYVEFTNLEIKLKS